MLNDGYHKRYNYSNGYGASVVSNKYTYGGEAGLFEVAIMHNDKLCYATEITSDVIGHQDHADVLDLLARIAALPRKERCTHDHKPERMFELSVRYYTRDESLTVEDVSATADSLLKEVLVGGDRFEYLKVVGG